MLELNKIEILINFTSGNFKVIYKEEMNPKFMSKCYLSYCHPQDLLTSLLRNIQEEIESEKNMTSEGLIEVSPN